MKRAVTMAQLIAAAREVRQRAYAPYSKYFVGAAIATESGRIFAGCNFENATYGAAICAERNAIGHMIAAGERKPVACAVVTAGPRGGSPCGICRQVLWEFASDMPIALIGEGPRGTTRRDTSLKKLLPDGFRLKR